MINRTMIAGVTLGILAALCGCTIQGASMMGVAVGQGLGTPFGVTATALDEAVHTTRDIVRANPRYANRAQPAAPQTVAVPRRTESRRPGGARPPDGNEQTCVYRAEVLVTTRGPARIEAIEFNESEEVARFWR